jgi:hypothetical protein
MPVCFYQRRVDHPYCYRGLATLSEGGGIQFLIPNF